MPVSTQFRVVVHAAAAEHSSKSTRCRADLKPVELAAAGSHAAGMVLEVQECCTVGDWGPLTSPAHVAYNLDQPTLPLLHMWSECACH